MWWSRPTRRAALAALTAHGVRLVCGQLPVVSDTSGVASAVDLVGLRGDQLVLVELKTGYDEGRMASARSGGRAQTMRAPLGAALLE